MSCWILVAGCGSTPPRDPSTAELPRSNASPAANDASGDAVAPPTLGRLMKMNGGLHLLWSTPAGSTCDSIEGERKTSASPYAVVFTVSGEVGDKHDATATEATNYTYRLRCKTGGKYSVYSNEMSAAPK